MGLSNMRFDNSNKGENRAVNETVAFAKSDLIDPPKQMVDAVNLYLKLIDRRRVRCPIDQAVPHRLLLADKLAIKVLGLLTPTQLAKAERALKEIAKTYVRIYKIYRFGNLWQADIARDNKYMTTEVEHSLAKDFRRGTLSMEDIADMFLGDS